MQMGTIAYENYQKVGACATAWLRFAVRVCGKQRKSLIVVFTIPIYRRSAERWPFCLPRLPARYPIGILEAPAAYLRHHNSKPPRASEWRSPSLLRADEDGLRLVRSPMTRSQHIRELPPDPAQRKPSATPEAACSRISSIPAMEAAYLNSSSIVQASARR